MVTISWPTTHLANALAIEALKRDRRAPLRPTHRLLVLDDFGLHPLTPQASQDLYEIISERYERASLILTSNRALEGWATTWWPAQPSTASPIMPTPW